MMQLAASEPRATTGPSFSGVSGRFRVKEWSAIGLGMQTQDQWRAWAHGLAPGTAASDTNASVPTLLRRRVTPIGQQAMRAAYPLAIAGARYIFCSRHGEFQRTLGLLQTIAMREPSSPADFSLSVHNALAGLLSIATKNPAGHTAIAAGTDSFGFGFLEAIGCLVEQPDDPVLLVYFDEPLPAPYAELPETGGPGVAVALLLATADSEPGNLIFSAELPASAGAAAPRECQALDFMRFFLSERDELVYPGARLVWRWTRDS